MAKELRKDGESATNESAGDLGDTLSRKYGSVIGGLQWRWSGRTVRDRVAYVQRYTMTRSQVASWLRFALTLETRRMMLEIQALGAVSHDMSRDGQNVAVQEADCEHGRDSYLMFRGHLQSPRRKQREGQNRKVGDNVDYGTRD